MEPDFSTLSGLNRRALLTGAALLGGTGGLGLGARARADDTTPQAGGTLRLGMTGGATSDSLDPRAVTDWVPVNLAFQVMNGLVEIDEKNQPVPELLERWEAKPGFAEWVFDVRRGVTFSNGKTLDADDIIYSLNLHRGETKSAAKATLGDITDVRKLSSHQVDITLSSGNVDLPYLLSDYHFFVVPNGWTDWMKPVGTGGYTLEVFEPGIRSVTKKRSGYWKPGCGHVDAIEILCINDTNARTNALVSGQVDVVNRLDARTVDLLKRRSGLQVIRNAAGQHAVFLMNVTDKPYDDVNVRLALKYGIDRQGIIDTVLHGYGVIGNDHPIPRTNPFYAADLPQRAYDRDKAKFHLKQAGLTTLPVTLAVSDAAFTGATDASLLYQEACKPTGIEMTVERKAADGYFSAVWMKAPFCVSYWGGRPTADQMLTIAYKSDAAWNETSWKRPDFDKILLAARTEDDVVKRKAMYFELQKMISDDGGAVIPMFIDYLEGGGSRVKGMKPHPLFDLMGQRIGEKVWLAF
ncbi:ABC transporter substrate-binding protein [Lichenifustis flavocetrariae]|uniref:ABC transporter substrate-binding protein n=1 Tax=Lichenifustis flavocetrariae TaxID=2949735 RepID=A0AA41YYN4_9HYPH|nr:ABC transporter substrate-binding protein [Lichenifustis flavocetrariae]MCW6509508.1 ABC transporter substrate-binding protein [Lichenifustis flavocetrariae]